MYIRKPKSMGVKPIGIAAELTQLYNQSSDLFLASKGDVSRIKSLRPSQLPFCPTNFFIQNATFGATRVLDMRGAFYTSIGTEVHEVLQTYLGHSGRFLADWECKQCGKWNRLSMTHECCDFQMSYHEIKVNYKGVVGHIDAVFKDSRGRFWIVDYKTTSIASSLKKLKEPGIAYVEQAETYSLLLWLEHGIKVHGVVLFFVKRDKPIEPIVWSKVLTDADFKRIKNRTVRYKRQHTEVLNIATLKEALALSAYDKCESPWCKTCKSSVPITSQLKTAFFRGEAAHRLPLKLLTSK